MGTTEFGVNAMLVQVTVRRVCARSTDRDGVVRAVAAAHRELTALVEAARPEEPAPTPVYVRPTAGPFCFDLAKMPLSLCLSFYLSLSLLKLSLSIPRSLPRFLLFSLVLPVLQGQACFGSIGLRRTIVL